MVSHKDLTELEELLRRHNELRVKELLSPAERPESLLGVNGTLFLLKVLERSSDLLADCVDNIKRHRILSLYILTRAHYETTANLIYFLNKLTKLYSKEIERDEVEETLGKLSVGSKRKLDDGGVDFPDPVNVLTTIAQADKFLRRSGSDVDMFAGSYAFISEIAHPNHLGISYRSKTNLEAGKVIFQTDQESFERFEKSAVNKLLISANLFAHYYEKAFALLEANETMPTLVRDNSTELKG